MTIRYCSETYHNPVSIRITLPQDTLRLKSDSPILSDTIPAKLNQQQDSLSGKVTILKDSLGIRSDSTFLNKLSTPANTVARIHSPLPMQAEFAAIDTIKECRRNAIADITYYDPDNIISSIDISSANLFPFIFTEKTRKMISDRKASVEKHLKSGQSIPDKLFHEDWTVGIILVAIFLFSIARARSKSYLPGITRFFLFRGTKEESSRDFMGIFQWQATILNLSSFLIVGLFVYFIADYYNLIPSEISGVVVWIISVGTIIAAVTLRHIICFVTGILSGQEEVFRDYLHTIYQSYRFSALLLFMLVVMMSYTSILPSLSYVIAGVILFLSLYSIRIFRLFIIFINRNISIFYLILYLCALEILPVLIVIKYFSGLT